MLRRLTRSHSKRMLGGVCGGLAEYFGIDPTVIRLVWAILSIATVWPGFVAYAVAWIVIPPEF
ncbi:MAG: PspC domain-containing protein [Firmicutes bacterium]|nr:PspC domain-containing protein [Bacillota bacterium]